MKGNFFIYGFPSTGKTFTIKELVTSFGVHTFDTDDMLGAYNLRLNGKLQPEIMRHINETIRLTSILAVDDGHVSFTFTNWWSPFVSECVPDLIFTRSSSEDVTEIINKRERPGKWTITKKEVDEWLSDPAYIDWLEDMKAKTRVIILERSEFMRDYVLEHFNFMPKKKDTIDKSSIEEPII